MKRIIIAAVAKNRVIGKKEGGMPWHIPEDFKHFKATTYGFPLAMGRKSFESLGGKPLKGRTNIVITRRDDYAVDHELVKVVGSLDDALNLCREMNVEKMFIAGGGEIYKQAIQRDLVDEMILSHLSFEAEGEVLFPEFDESKWEITHREEREKFEIVTYVRKR